MNSNSGYEFGVAPTNAVPGERKIGFGDGESARPNLVLETRSRQWRLEAVAVWKQMIVHRDGIGLVLQEIEGARVAACNIDEEAHAPRAPAHSIGQIRPSLDALQRRTVEARLFTVAYGKSDAAPRRRCEKATATVFRLVLPR